MWGLYFLSYRIIQEVSSEGIYSFTALEEGNFSTTWSPVRWQTIIILSVIFIFPLSQEGFLIAPDTNKSENLVTGNSISYSLTIIYNVDNFEPFLSNKVKVFAWQKT